MAKGYAQREGIDYNEVFSHVIKHSSIRILLALAVIAQYELDLDQLDVKTAFLHDELYDSVDGIQNCRQREHSMQAKEITVWIKTIS